MPSPPIGANLIWQAGCEYHALTQHLGEARPEATRSSYGKRSGFVLG
jgi:hypothetical protein